MLSLLQYRFAKNTCNTEYNHETCANTQNRRLYPSELDDGVRRVFRMTKVHNSCLDTAEAYGTPGNYVNGANIAGFLKVADSMLKLFPTPCPLLPDTVVLLFVAGYDHGLFFQRLDGTINVA